MLLASVNLNKWPGARSDPAAHEPFEPPAGYRSHSAGLTFASRDGHLAAWPSETSPRPPPGRPADRAGPGRPPPRTTAHC